MKNLFKGLFLTLAFVFASTFTAMADRDIPIEFRELPTTAQRIIKSNFPGHKVAMAKKEVDMFEQSYDVIFTNGNKIEFNAKGQWQKISCKKGAVPTSLVPPTILQYVKSHYRGIRIQEIEREDGKFEVELSNDLDLTFNRAGRLIEIDD